MLSAHNIINIYRRALYSACLVGLFLSIAVSCVFSQGVEVGRARVGVANAPGAGGVTGARLQTDYRIGAGDTIEILVWREPELSRKVKIRADGKFSYPLIGTVNAAGLTVDELQNTITEKFLKYIKFPEVTVAVLKSTSYNVVVLGEVYYPGIYAYEGAIDVVTAIGMAGDFNQEAKRESVIIVSGNCTDNPTARRVNVFRSLYHGSKGRDFMLKPNDVVYVPKTFIQDLNKSIEDMQPLLSAFNTNFMDTRRNVRTLWYNRDKPISKVSPQ